MSANVKEKAGSSTQVRVLDMECLTVMRKRLCYSAARPGGVSLSLRWTLCGDRRHKQMVLTPTRFISSRSNVTCVTCRRLLSFHMLVMLDQTGVPEMPRSGKYAWDSFVENHPSAEALIIRQQIKVYEAHGKPQFARGLLRQSKSDAQVCFDHLMEQDGDNWWNVQTRLLP